MVEPGNVYVEYETELEETLPEKIRRNLKKIIAVVAIIIVAYFLYYYFIASLKEVEIFIQGMDGAKVNNARIEIVSEDGKTTLYKGEGYTHYATTLREGTYVVIVSAPDFLKKEETIEVGGEEGGSFNIIMQKDLKTKITSLEIPQRIYQGQKLNVEVILENTSAHTERLELLLEGAFSELLCEAPSIVSVQAKSEETVAIKCSVPEEISIPRGKTSTKKNFKVRIKYTGKSKSKDVDVFLAPEITTMPVKFNVNPTTKPKDRKEFRIYNKSRFSVEDLNVYFEITSAKENDPEEVLSWLRFTKETGEEANKTTILYIPGKDRETLNIELSVPTDAKSEVIYGNIVINAEFLAEPIKTPMTITISKEVNVGVKVTASTSIVSFTNREIGADRLIYLRVYNEGDLTLNNVRIIIENPEECTSEWLEPLSTSVIDSIEPKKTKELPYTAKAHAVGTVRCLIKALYESPVPPNELQESDIEVLEIKVRET